jgi:F-type H+-transporting ATPase subunit gamma
MAKARAVLKRLKAVKNVRKITRTMELIATARFKKAMDRATEAAAYTKKLGELAADLSAAAGEFTHPLLEQREQVKSSVLLVLTSNRGLAGGYNSNVLKGAQLRIREAKAAGESLQLEVSGKRGINFMKFQKAVVDQTYTHFEDRPLFDQVEEIANRFIQLFVDGKIDRVDVAYMRFLSASRQTATVETLLPFKAPTDGKGAAGGGSTVDYEFLPSAREILDEIVPSAFKARLFKCFLDAAVCEQIFRMVAMKGATENAAEMIQILSKTYNRARQAQITSELSEIIGGAAALE